MVARRLNVHRDHPDGQNDRPRRSSRPTRSDDDERQATPAQHNRSQESSTQTSDEVRDGDQVRHQERDQATDESDEPRRRRRGRRGGRGRGRRK